jgi:hypothetical protein
MSIAQIENEQNGTRGCSSSRSPVAESDREDAARPGWKRAGAV